MSNNWYTKLLNILFVGSLLIVGIFFAGTAILFNDYGGPPSSSDQAETLRLFMFGISLCTAGIINPLRTRNRALIAFTMITITAILILFLDGGQPDVESVYFLIILVGIPLYFLRRRFARNP